MPTVKLSVPHKLGADGAKARIQKLISENLQQMSGMVTDVKENWVENKNNFSFRAMGFNVAGAMTVQPSDVLIEVNLPLAALPFKSKMEQELKTRAQQLLA
jgi:hypothetical protein